MDNEINVGCGLKCDKCEIEEAKNECENCGKYFCSTCEIRVKLECTERVYLNS